MSRPSATAVAFASATQLQGWLSSGVLTAAELVSLHLERIARIDRQGPSLRAVIETNPEALAQAHARDTARKTQPLASALDGVSILVKDNIASADQMQTSAGSLALADGPARQDAFIIKRLRLAGVILLGKTNLSEWANIRSTRSSSGWSAQGGLTRNPHVLDRSASGSSSGSAVAVAAGLVAAALGTETDGSIVSPASVNGIVGIKPTVGLVSRHGIIPISSTQDTAGTMARNVTDAALLLAAIAGRDDNDPATHDAPQLKLLSALSNAGLNGKRLGIVRSSFGDNPQVLKMLDAALDRLVELGAVLVDEVTLPATDTYGDAETLVLLTEFKVALPAYLAHYAQPHQPQDLAGLIAFNRAHAAKELAEFGQELFEQAQNTKGLEDSAYRDALALCRRQAASEGINKVMREGQLDALIALTGDPAWPIDLVNGDRSGRSFSTPAAVAGYPHITVPMGAVRSLPVGLSFVGLPYTEPALIGMAFAFESAQQGYAQPAFLPSVPLLDDEGARSGS